MKTLKVETTPYDSADYLLNQDDISAYVAAATEMGDPELLKSAIETVKRAESALKRKTQP
mgnify:CR=1 FL=1